VAAVTGDEFVGRSHGVLERREQMMTNQNDSRFGGDCKAIRYHGPNKRLGVFRAAALFAAVLCSCRFSPPARAVIAGERGPSPEVMAENTSELIEIAQIRIANATDGVIEVSDDGAWRSIGKVLQPANNVDRMGFTASKWAPAGTVCGAAVNALHIKVGLNEAEDRGITLSLAPKEFAPGSNRPFEEAAIPSATIFTDIPAGMAIFGGDYTPLVGSPVFVEREGALVPLPPDYVPAAGDALVISIRRPAQYPSQIIFENRFGGFIYLQYPNGCRKLIGEVLRPVIGVGRFAGGLYAGIGRVRANHPGVIDISTSLIGEVGGFQIVPANHAMSPETKYVRRLTQWMVVGPLDARDPSWEGVAPLFLQYLRPKYNAQDLYAEDWQERLLGRFLVDVQIAGRWQAMPHLGVGSSPNAPLPDWAMTALEDVEAIRILFPLEPQCRP